MATSAFHLGGKGDIDPNNRVLVKETGYDSWSWMGETKIDLDLSKYRMVYATRSTTSLSNGLYLPFGVELTYHEPGADPGQKWRYYKAEKDGFYLLAKGGDSNGYAWKPAYIYGIL